jgi:hypothetical protein
MPDYDRIDDMVQRGRGLAAFRVGALHTLFRPRTPLSPTGSGNAIMTMPALFTPSAGRSALFGHPLYEGVVDAAYTRPGDYLVGPQLTWFVANQSPLLPVLCVKATRVIGVSRVPVTGAAGLAGYGGLQRASAVTVLAGWPASVVAHGYGLDRADLPADVPLEGWSILLPPLPANVILRSGDLVTDDLGRAGIVSSAESSDLGWRLFARQTAT